MSKVYDNLRKPTTDTTATRRTRDDSANDLDLFSFAEARRAREEKKTEQAPAPVIEKKTEPVSPPVSTPREEPVLHEPAPRFQEPVRTPLRPQAPRLRKPSLNIFSEEAASAGMEQETSHPVFVSRWIWGGVAVLIVVLLPFLIFKKRDSEPATTEELLLAHAANQAVVEEEPKALLTVEEPPRIEIKETVPEPVPAPPPPPPSKPVAEQQAAAVTAPTPAAPPAEIPGAMIRRDKREMTIVFKQGLFSRAAELAPQARATLTQVAQWIPSHAAGYKIMVLGCTDNETVRPNSGYKSNRELGLLRAQTVEKFLLGRGELKGFAISSSSRGEKDAPYPNDSKENRRKNRTVMIRLVPQ
jgi:flagellar motor protein MotB